MRILYVVQSITPDEEEIRKALYGLGHQVYTITDTTVDQLRSYDDFDFLLFHHTHLADKLAAIPLPRFFWYFDLVNVHGLEKQSAWRRVVVNNAVHISLQGFCTDGDMVHWYPGKMTRLLQGAHGTAPGVCKTVEPIHDVLFAGTTFGREDFLNEVGKRFKLTVVKDEDRVWGPAFADLIASSKIVLAPDWPIKEFYWSNRVYVVSGFGGFLMHPYIRDLSYQYKQGEEIVFYENREQLYNLMDFYLQQPEERQRIAQNARLRTLKDHLYTHRVESLVDQIKPYLIGAKA